MAVRYVSSGTNARNLEVLGKAEFAFVGRSNVGKSSLVGKVMPKLVKRQASMAEWVGKRCR